MALAVLGASLAGCSFANLAFVVDKRIQITAPASRTLVTLPVTLHWSIRGFSIAAPGQQPPSADAGYFAIFVDRAPIGPGQTLRAVANGDHSCLQTPGCPNQQYLSDRQVYTTTETSYTLTQVAALNDYQPVQLHEVTIILLDTAGHRIGESAWYLDFRLKQRILE